MSQSRPDLASDRGTSALAEGLREFLSFRLGTEEYGVDILKVQEIRGCDTVTQIPETPAFIKGVINLRGTIVPVIDMRVKFKLASADYNAFTVMIVLNLGTCVVGMVVDSVSDVIQLKDEQIREVPEFVGAINSGFVMGIGTFEDRMLILIDIDKVMAAADLLSLQPAVQVLQ